MRHSPLVLASLALALGSAVAGCGQKGPLVLPDTDTSGVVIRPSSPAPSTPAPPATPAGNASSAPAAGSTTPPPPAAPNVPAAPGTSAPATGTAAPSTGTTREDDAPTPPRADDAASRH